MKFVVPVLRSATLLLLGGGLGLAQLATAPASPSATRTPAGAAGAPGVSAPARHPARVAYSHGQLEVSADNSSLNQVLHEIGRATGMKITGDVADSWVFGTYGPGAPAAILDRLLDGTGMNMLLKLTASGAPAELILTPRNGAATPPNPAAAQAAEEAPAPPPPAPARVGDPGTEGIIVRDINGNPAPPGSAIPSTSLPPALTPEQQQQRVQQMQQQQQQEQQQRQQAGPH